MITQKFTRALVLLATLALYLFALASSRPAAAQTASDFDRERGRAMLDMVKNDIKKNYFDPSFRGIDLEVRFKTAADKIKTAASNSQIFSIIAQLLTEFEDSHTYFLPPSRAARTDYGWQMQIVGDKCYVTAVKPKSDAEAKGLMVGDEIWSIDGFGPTRENLWKLKYLYYTLQPRRGMRLVTKKPGGQERQVDVLAKIQDGKQLTDLTGDGIWDLIRDSQSEDRLHRHRYYEIGDDLFIWKMPQFDLSEADVDSLMGKVRKRKALVLDLRGNGGGAVSTLERLAGFFFDRNITLVELKGRKEMKPMIAKTRGDSIFKGQLVVLVDSASGSASEIFARVVQIEKRGTVIGDRTAGAVMRARHIHHQAGVDIVAFYGISVTDADVIMSDGKGLERVGVVPDEVLLPSATDMAAGRDRVLTRAAELVGVKLESEKAGSLFPVEWRK